MNDLNIYELETLIKDAIMFTGRTMVSGHEHLFDDRDVEKMYKAWRKSEKRNYS